MFGQCVSECKFPESWKVAKLILIPKPGKTDKSQVKSFRPISLLPVFGKALETLIISDILKETSLDTLDEQHGFTTGKSTLSAIKEVYMSIDASKAKHVLGTCDVGSRTHSKCKMITDVGSTGEPGCLLRNSKDGSLVPYQQVCQLWVGRSLLLQKSRTRLTTRFTAWANVVEDCNIANL